MVVKKHGLSSGIGDLVRQTRKLAGLSQNELADLAGVGKTLVFDLEKGHESIGLNKLRKILHVLNIQLSFIPPQIIGAPQKPLLRKKKNK